MSFSESEDLSDSDFTPEGALKTKLHQRKKQCLEEPVISVKEAAEDIAEILENFDQEEVPEVLDMALSWLGLAFVPTTETERKKRSTTR